MAKTVTIAKAIKGRIIRENKVSEFDGITVYSSAWENDATIITKPEELENIKAGLVITSPELAKLVPENVKNVISVPAECLYEAEQQAGMLFVA